jgi:hypothetical protein
MSLWESGSTVQESVADATSLAGCWRPLEVVLQAAGLDHSTVARASVAERPQRAKGARRASGRARPQTVVRCGVNVDGQESPSTCKRPFTRQFRHKVARYSN